MSVRAPSSSVREGRRNRNPLLRVIDWILNLAPRTTFALADLRGRKMPALRTSQGKQGRRRYFTATLCRVRNRPRDLRYVTLHLASILLATCASPGLRLFRLWDKSLACIACEYSPLSFRMHRGRWRFGAGNIARPRRVAPVPRGRECKPECPGCALVR